MAFKFEQLKVWQRAVDYTLAIHNVTRSFPKEEMFGITSQIRRSSVSVAANIAESYGRRTPNDKARFFTISEGSLDETKYFLILAKDLGFISSNDVLLEKVNEVSKLLFAYKKAILNS